MFTGRRNTDTRRRHSRFVKQSRIVRIKGFPWRPESGFSQALACIYPTLGEGCD